MKMRQIYLRRGAFFILLSLARRWFSFQVHHHFGNFDKLLTLHIDPEERVFSLDVG